MLLLILTMSSLNAPTGMGELWQQRIASMREYEVVRDGNMFGAGFSNNVVFSSRYEKSRQHLGDLTQRYVGKPVETVFSGCDINNGGGSCFSITTTHSMGPPQIDPPVFRKKFLENLMLVHGIGPSTQRHLKSRGFTTLHDLLSHPRYRISVQNVLGCLTQGNTAEMIDLISTRHPKSHPLVLGTAAFHKPEDLVFVDIETLGLFSRPIILFGIGRYERGQLVIHQYLIRDIPEEEAALVATCGHFAGDNPALVTFNGKSFDLPYIQDRLAYYGMEIPACIPHYDVLHFSRRRWKDQFPSHRLSTLESEIFGISRQDDVPGQMVPEFYETYLRTGNCGPLVPVVEHNRQDVLSLAMLFFHLLGESYGR
jgi:uncharacterized protein